MGHPIQVAPSATTAPGSMQARCPNCGTINQFVPAGATTRCVCGNCGIQFHVSSIAQQVAQSPSQVRVPISQPTPGYSRTPCQFCGVLNEFPTPAPGRPWPRVQCGGCGKICQTTRQ